MTFPASAWPAWEPAKRSATPSFRYGVRWEVIDTGAALRNLSESELTLTCRLMMGGEMMEMQPVTLPA